MPNQETGSNIEIRSEEVQEILSHIPNWLIRWGITAIFSAVLLVLVASWFIKYPDVVTARVTITTPIPPVNIVAKASGPIELMIKDGENIKKGKALGVIENAAKTADFFLLMNLCDKIINNEKNISTTLEYDLELGNIQPAYIQFARSVSDLKLFKELKYFEEQISMLEERIDQYKALNISLKSQISIQERALYLAQENYTRDSLLFSNDATTKFDKNNTESVLLQSKTSFQLSKANLINNTIQIGQLQSQIADLRSKNSEQEKILYKNIQQTFEQLKSQLEVWKQQFLFTSSIDGIVSLSTYWSDNQNVNIGDVVMTIIPQETLAFGRVELPVSGSGKVEEGQRVNIKLDNYPYQEYGMVVGEIQSKSIVPINNNYILTLSLPSGLKSSYNKELAFDREMQGTAEIITKDLRIIERVFNQFRALFDNAG